MAGAAVLEVKIGCFHVPDSGVDSHPDNAVKYVAFYHSNPLQSLQDLPKKSRPASIFRRLGGVRIWTMNNPRSTPRVRITLVVEVYVKSLPVIFFRSAGGGESEDPVPSVLDLDVGTGECAAVTLDDKAEISRRGWSGCLFGKGTWLGERSGGGGGLGMLPLLGHLALCGEGEGVAVHVVDEVAVVEVVVVEVPVLGNGGASALSGDEEELLT